MTSILLHDGNRPGSLTWAEVLLGQSLAHGMILTPYCTPRRTIPPTGKGRQATVGAADSRSRLDSAGGTTFFDPMTHGILIPGAGGNSHYDTWDLWPGVVKGSMTEADLATHVTTVLERCDEFDLRAIAPTLQLFSPSSPNADRALMMATLATEAANDVFVAIVGSSAFWSSGSALDAYVGELVQLRPAGWSITVTRDALKYPPLALDPDEIAGLCRTAHSLSLRGAPVIVSHGDLAALPAVAGGATHLGTGWDLRHRVCADDLFRPSGGVRRQSLRVTYDGLVAALKRVEAEQVAAGDPALSHFLVPGPLPSDHNAHWVHHVRVLKGVADRIETAGQREDRVTVLRAMYAAAVQHFGAVQSHVGKLEAGATQWIQPVAAGLDLYAHDEGW